jgi:hypothetical protein
MFLRPILKSMAFFVGIYFCIILNEKMIEVFVLSVENLSNNNEFNYSFT